MGLTLDECVTWRTSAVAGSARHHVANAPGPGSPSAAMAPTAHAIIARPLIGTAVLMGAASTFVAMNNGVQYSFSPTALTASGWLSGKTKSGDAGPSTRSIVSLIMRE